MKFSDAQDLLKEGDILLFRGTGLISYFIQRVGRGPYSHVGIASSYRPNGKVIWECVEFREWKGGRAINLERYVDQNSGLIDVYRAESRREVPVYREGRVYTKNIYFNGRDVTEVMRKLTGLPYGWHRIWSIMQIKIPVLRMFGSLEKIYDDTMKELVYPVCSTAISHAFAKYGYDLTPNRSDEYMEPSDISRSSSLHYLFTLETG